MTTVTSINSESLLEFLTRERAVSTASVANRFGWSMQRSYRELTALHEQGLITKQLESFRTGSMNGWRVRAPQ